MVRVDACRRAEDLRFAARKFKCSTALVDRTARDQHARDARGQRSFHDCGPIRSEAVVREIEADVDQGGGIQGALILLRAAAA